MPVAAHHAHFALPPMASATPSFIGLLSSLSFLLPTTMQAPAEMDSGGKGATLGGLGLRMRMERTDVPYFRKRAKSDAA